MPERSGSGHLATGHEWRVYPYVRHKVRGRIALVAIVLTGALVARTTGNAGFGAIAAAVLIASTLSFFVPSAYRAAPDGLTVERLGTRSVYAWSRFRSLERLGSRIWLSPFPEGSRAARFRSLRLDLPEDGDEVCEYVRARIGTGP